MRTGHRPRLFGRPHDANSDCTKIEVRIPGGLKVLDANGQSLAYVYGRETKADADIAKVLTMDEARKITSNIAKLPTFLNKRE